MLKRGSKFFVKGPDGHACGPLRWTTVREWVAIGSFTPEDEVRLADDTAWSRIDAFPELLASPPADQGNDALVNLRFRAREKKPVGPRASAYLAALGCPIPPQRLNPFTAFQWVQILEELHPQLANATERWAAEEESHGRVAQASPEDATPAQLESLRIMGCDIPAHLTRLQARRLISGPPTEGQLRRLAFYEVPLPKDACKDEAAELIDRHMRENWHTEAAYQAFRQRERGEPTTHLKLAVVSNLPPPSEDAMEEISPSAAGMGHLRTPAPKTAGEATSSPRGATPYIVATCLIALAAIAVTWWMRKERLQQTVTQGAPPPVEAASVSPADRLARAVTLLESPNRAQAEKLRAYVIALSLTGVLGGAEPRALIEGRPYRVGDVIDASRGVVLLQVDSDQRLVVFGDGEGDIVQRVLE